MPTTVIILICLSFGAIIGLCCACLLIPASISDAWHAGYEAARQDQAESEDKTPAIHRKSEMLKSEI